MAAEAGDGSGKHGFHAFTKTNFASDVAGDALVAATPHEFEGFLNSRFGKQVQIGRLFELDREGLLQRAIEDGVSRGVDEIGEEDRIFFREGASATSGEETAYGDGNDNRGEDNPQQRLSLHGLHDGGGNADGGRRLRRSRRAGGGNGRCSHGPAGSMV